MVHMSPSTTIGPPLSRTTIGSTPKKPAATRLAGSYRSGTPVITVFTAGSSTRCPSRCTLS